VRIRALSVFEGVVYHCVCVEPSQPCRPTLEVDAVLRPGDADAEAGPLLLTVSEYAAMVGDQATARRCVDELMARGRVVERLGVAHVSFPTWTPVDPA
jgi:(2Fe-2S) ferredoxin